MGTRAPIALLACGCFNPPTNMHLRMFERARDYLEKTLSLKVVEGMISPANDGYGKPGLLPAAHRTKMVQLATETSDWIRLEPWESSQPAWCRTIVVLRKARESLQRKHMFSSLSPNKVRSNSLVVGADFQKSPPSISNWPTMTSSSEISSTNERRGGAESAEKSTNQQRGEGPNAKKMRKTGEMNSVGKEEVSKTREGTFPATEAPHLMLLCGADLLESFAVPDLWLKEDMEEIVRDFGLVVLTRAGTDPRKFIYESDMLTKYERNIHIVTEWISNEISSTKIRRALQRQESIKYLVPDTVADYIDKHALYRNPAPAEHAKESINSSWIQRNGGIKRKNTSPAE